MIVLMKQPRTFMYKLSEHARSRCAQRSFRAEDIALILHYGTPTTEGVLMTEQAVREAAADLRAELRQLNEEMVQMKRAA
jgi:hypothetical protein